MKVVNVTANDVSSEFVIRARGWRGVRAFAQLEETREVGMADPKAGLTTDSM